MQAFDVALAILREWPGTEERLERLARAQAMLPVLTWRDGRQIMVDPRIEQADRWARIRDDYFRQWAGSFMSESLARLTNEELSIRLAIAERLVLEAEGREVQSDYGPVVTHEQDSARAHYDRVAHEIARRDVR